VVSLYEERLGALPPIVVFQEAGTDDFLVGDGFHRVKAHKNQNAGEISATLLPGGRKAAMLFAATANIDHGLQLTREDYVTAGKRLLSLGVKPATVAKQLGKSKEWANTLGHEADVRKELGEVTMHPSAIQALWPAGKEHWKHLAELAQHRRWTVDDIQDVAGRVAKDSKLIAEVKAAVETADRRPLTKHEVGQAEAKQPVTDGAAKATGEGKGDSGAVSPSPEAQEPGSSPTPAPKETPLPSSSVRAPTGTQKDATDDVNIAQLSDNMDYAIEGMEKYGTTKVAAAFVQAQHDTGDDYDYILQLDRYCAFLGNVSTEMKKIKAEEGEEPSSDPALLEQQL
jgi:hypothetical protein